MSKISIEGNASGTGTFTIESPNTDSNFTLTLPEATGTIITTAGGAAISGTTGSFSGDLSFNSGFGSAGTAYGCRAWVNFNGTGTVAIRASGNVTSITDNGTGNYTVNFTTAMPDDDYAAVITPSHQSGGALSIAGAFSESSAGGFSTSSFQVNVFNISNNRTDNAFITVAIFR